MTIGLLASMTLISTIVVTLRRPRLDVVLTCRKTTDTVPAAERSVVVRDIAELALFFLVILNTQGSQRSVLTLAAIDATYLVLHDQPKANPPIPSGS